MYLESGVWKFYFRLATALQCSKDSALS